MSFFSLQIAIIFKSVELQMLLTLKLLTFCPPKERSGMGLLFKFSSPSFNSYCLLYLWFHYIYIRILVFFNRDVPPPPCSPRAGLRRVGAGISQSRRINRAGVGGADPGFVTVFLHPGDEGHRKKFPAMNTNPPKKSKKDTF